MTRTIVSLAGVNPGAEKPDTGGATVAPAETPPAIETLAAGQQPGADVEVAGAGQEPEKPVSDTFIPPAEADPIAKLREVIGAAANDPNAPPGWKKLTEEVQVFLDAPGFGKREVTEFTHIDQLIQELKNGKDLSTGDYAVCADFIDGMNAGQRAYLLQNAERLPRSFVGSRLTGSFFGELLKRWQATENKIERDFSCAKIESGKNEGQIKDVDISPLYIKLTATSFTEVTFKNVSANFPVFNGKLTRVTFDKCTFFSPFFIGGKWDIVTFVASKMEHATFNIREVKSLSIYSCEFVGASFSQIFLLAVAGQIRMGNGSPSNFDGAVITMPLIPNNDDSEAAQRIRERAQAAQEQSGRGFNHLLALLNKLMRNP